MLSDEIERPEDVTIKRLIKAAKAALSDAEMQDDVRGELEQSVEDAEALFESDDPISNGWVGADGLP